MEITTALEERLGVVENDFYPLKREIKVMKDQMGIQVANVDETQNTLGRNNLRVVGIPERSADSNPIVFLEEWFREIFVQ